MKYKAKVTRTAKHHSLAFRDRGELGMDIIDNFNDKMFVWLNSWGIGHLYYYLKAKWDKMDPSIKERVEGELKGWTTEEKEYESAKPADPVKKLCSEDVRFYRALERTCLEMGIEVPEEYRCEWKEIPKSWVVKSKACQPLPTKILAKIEEKYTEGSDRDLFQKTNKEFFPEEQPVLRVEKKPDGGNLYTINLPEGSKRDLLKSIKEKLKEASDKKKVKTLEKIEERCVKREVDAAKAKASMDLMADAMMIYGSKVKDMSPVELKEFINAKDTERWLPKED